MRNLFLVSLGIRLAAYLGLNLFVFHWGFEHPDSILYNDTALALAGQWKEGNWYLVGYPEYSNLIALVYYLLPNSPIFPTLLNVLIGSLIPVAALHILRPLPNRNFVAWALAFEPYSIYLSTVLLRDIYLVLGIVLLVGFLTRKGIGLAVLGILLLGLLRPLLGMAAVSLLILILLYRRQWVLTPLVVLSIIPGVWHGGLPIQVSRPGIQPGPEVRDPGLSTLETRVENIIGEGGQAGMVGTQVENVIGGWAQSGEVLPGFEYTKEGTRIAIMHTEFFEPRSGLTYSYFLSLSLPRKATSLVSATFDFFAYPYPWTADNFREVLFSTHILFIYIFIPLFLFSLRFSGLTFLTLGLIGAGIIVVLFMATPSQVIRYRLPFMYSAFLSSALLPSPKRTLDIILTTFSLLFTLPLFLALSLACGIFTQKRVGLNGKEFTLYKFRTMRLGSEGKAVKEEGDRRITRIGKVIRSLALDELPELVNVLRGDMSLVGPRPHAVWESEEARTKWGLANWNERHKVLPGIMGLAQYKCHREDLTTKLKWDLEYIQKQSLWLDVKLLFLGTIGTLRRNWV